MEVNFSSLTKTESPPLVSENNQFLKVMTVLAQQNFLDMPDMDNLSLVNRYAYQRSRTIEMNPVHIKLSTTAKILAFKAAQYFWNEDDSEDEEQQI